MPRQFTPFLTTLGYVLSPDRERVLLIHRNKRPCDRSFGKYNGLGGGLERDENVAAGMRRELLEEANLAATRMAFRGTVSWPGSGTEDGDRFAFVFLITEWTGNPFLQCAEGTLEWIRLEILLGGSLNLWPSDTHFLPMVFDDDPSPFHGVFHNRDDERSDWQFSR